MVISSTTNEWPQQQIDETALMASSGMIMEKPVPDQALKCPRCDSSNTKFCYYNNYSLSQPRHFCKACKRYWTRGGTLRNVPVGGGCRKNKRIKRSAPSADPSPSLPSPAPTPPPPPKINVSTASNQISPLFYGLPSAPSDINLPFPSFNSRASNVETVPTSCTGYDLQPQFNQEYRTGFNHTSQIQDGFASNSLISNYSILGSSSSTRASLMASSLQQQKLMWGGLKGREFGNNIEALQPFHGLQMEGNSDPGMIMKEMKMEEVGQNPIEQIRSSDPSLYWDSMTVGAWPDLNNFGSSVTSLI